MTGTFTFLKAGETIISISPLFQSITVLKKTQQCKTHKNPFLIVCAGGIYLCFFAINEQVGAGSFYRPYWKLFEVSSLKSRGGHLQPGVGFKNIS